MEKKNYISPLTETLLMETVGFIMTSIPLDILGDMGAPRRRTPVF